MFMTKSSHGLSQTGVLTSVVLQQDYGGVNCARAGIRRAGRHSHTVVNVSEGWSLVFFYAVW